MKRGRPLRRSTPLSRGRPLERATSKLKAQSDRRKAETAERRRVVAEVRKAHPLCERCRRRPTVDVHERRSRARRPGAHLMRDELVGLCRPCHDWVTTNPAAATAEGWLLPADDRLSKKILPRD